MCGIAGIFHADGRPAPAELAGAMIGMLRHRGPDDTRVVADRGTTLAHARLSIIDLAGGAQPMHNEDGSLWITFNGEIFNYLELRRELLDHGHRFATRSDTEVILHLYEEKGADCVSLLNGQWAFAIWDSTRQELFLSRDRLGVRPLFYTRAGRAFLFASEVKALFAHPDVSREIDPAGLDEIFTFWCTIPPRTAFRGIRELPPGHSMTVRGSAETVRPYWRLDYDPLPQPSGAAGERRYAEDLLELLIDATRLRLRSDVPVGAYLSGGLDSTFTTALIRKFTDARLRTFSVSFADPAFDESAYQREASEFLHTDHQELPCGTADIARVFPQVVWHTEKPILRTAPAPLFLLSELVRSEGFKVVITGEGADEILGGYDIYKEAKIRRFWQARPDSQLRPLLLRRLYPYLEGIRNQPDAYRRAFFHIGTDGEAEAFYSHLPRWQLTARLKALFSDELRAAARARTWDDLLPLLPAGYSSWPSFCQAQYLETRYLLPGYILSSQGDRAAMAHSVEGRFPFLDHRVVEFASRLPVNLKMKVLNEKYLLKRCAEGLIPPRVRARHKQPYRAPEGRCFLEPAAFGYLQEALSEAPLRRAGLFDCRAVGKLLDKFRRGAASGIKDNMALVGVVSTQLLAGQFFENFNYKITPHERRTAEVRN